MGISGEVLRALVGRRVHCRQVPGRHRLLEEMKRTLSLPSDRQENHIAPRTGCAQLIVS